MLVASADTVLAATVLQPKHTHMQPDRSHNRSIGSKSSPINRRSSIGDNNSSDRSTAAAAAATTTTTTPHDITSRPV
jgi:hypothetical protein